jgi:hypothetical protein
VDMKKIGEAGGLEAPAEDLLVKLPRAFDVAREDFEMHY